MYPGVAVALSESGLTDLDMWSAINLVYAKRENKEFRFVNSNNKKRQTCTYLKNNIFL